MTILDSEELARILDEGEGRQVEFKEGLSADGRVSRTICAFANTRGGIVLVGVSDRGEVRGVPRPLDVAREIDWLARRSVEPAVEVRVEVLKKGGRAIVCCSVPLSPDRPHVVRRGDASFAPEVLIRSGASNRAASRSALDDIVPVRVTPGPLEKAVLLGAAGAGTTVAAFAD